MLGITIDRIDKFYNTLAAVQKLVKPGRQLVARLVIDPGASVSDYIGPCSALSEVCSVMLQPVDSYAQLPTESWQGYTVDSYVARFDEVCAALGQYAISVEVLNEGGVWDPKYDPLIMSMGQRALARVTNRYPKLVPAVTWYLDLNQPMRMAAFAKISGIEVALNMISFYARSGDSPLSIGNALFMLNQQFSALHQQLPNAINFAIGECGTETATGMTGNTADKEAMVEAMYGFKPSIGGYVGGGFWWDFVSDCARDGMLMPAFEALP